MRTSMNGVSLSPSTHEAYVTNLIQRYIGVPVQVWLLLMESTAL